MNIQNTPDPKDAHGYVTDIPYTWSYFRFQNPVLLSYVALNKGHDAPDPAKSFAHCDLGCGNGVTTNLLAAAYPHAQFVGVDINPEHIDNANQLAERAGLTNVTFIDASFDELDRYDLPKFDYITMHGVYSWVQGQVRDQIHGAVDRLLAPNGLVYLCYNTLPGASNLIPLWKMMQTYSADLRGDLVSNAQTALSAITEMRDNNSRFFRTNPVASSFLDKLIARDSRYLVHEFSNGCYEPQYFWDVAENFGQLGLQFAGSAQLYRNDEKFLLSSRHRGHLDQAHTVRDRESRASYIRNESFRWDIFIRSSADPNPEETRSAVDNMYFGAERTRDELTGKTVVGRKELDLDSGLFRKVLDIAHNGTLRLSEILDHPELANDSRRRVRLAIDDLVAAECLHPSVNAAMPEKVSPNSVLRVTAQVNRALTEDRLLSEGKTYLVSPVSGFAVRLDLVNGCIALACHDNALKNLPEAVKARLNELKPELLRAKSSKSDIDADRWVNRKIRHFSQHYLPRLVRMGILAEK